MKNNRILVLTYLLLFCLFLFPNEQLSVKVLAIGNSFSEDAAAAYLDDLAQAAGINLIVGNAYIGGCSIDKHWQNANDNLSAYSYRKIIDGDSAHYVNKTLLQCLQDEDWDYITFQQVSQHAGMISTFFPSLTNLIAYVKTNARNQNLKLALHQTWAYAQNSTHSGFVNYNNNQQKMYNDVVNTINEVSQQTGIEIIIPSGTAIQNGRNSVLGDIFCRDGFHLSYGLGRYTAACAWFEMLFSRSVIGNTFIPKNVSKFEADIAQHAAHYAVLTPNQVNEMDGFQEESTNNSVLEFPIYIDFGGTVSVKPWNNLTSPTLNNSIADLIDSQENNTNIKISVENEFAGANSAAYSTTTTELNMPENVSLDCFWGNGEGVFSGKSIKKGEFVISNLNKNIAYDFMFFGSRANCTDNRETKFKVTGITEQVLTLNAANNTSNVVKAEGITPTSDGIIKIEVTAGENNNNIYKFFYINALRISSNNVSSVQNIGEKSILKLFPNPVRNVMHVESEIPIGKINILDLSGRTIFAHDATNRLKDELNLSLLENGIYVVQFHTRNLLISKI